jgi:hypothetical protein
MYTGHIAVALGVDRYRRRVPLVVLLLVAQAPDWVEQLFTALGYGNHAQLWSHSILAVVAGIAITASLYVALTRDTGGASLLAFVYLTHPVLDLVTGHKPLWPGGPPLGACLYNHPAADWVVESLVLLVGWFVYRAHPAAQRRNRLALALALLFGLIICQTAVDSWQALKIYRAPELAQCNEASASMAQGSDTHWIALFHSIPAVARRP